MLRHGAAEGAEQLLVPGSDLRLDRAIRHRQTFLEARPAGRGPVEPDVHGMSSSCSSVDQQLITTCALVGTDSRAVCVFSNEVVVEDGWR